MKKLITTSLILLSLTFLNAQQFDWAKSMGRNGYDKGIAITIDASGNIYTTGFFENTTDFDPGPGIFNLTSNGGYDIFIQKLDSSGNFVWAKSMGGSYYEQGESIDIDSSGNIYTTGYFQDTVDFDPGLSVFNLISNGNSDIFILKLDSSGNFIWAKSMGGSGTDFARSITTDAIGNIYTAGNFAQTVDFDPGNGIYNLTAWSNTTNAGFIQKLDNNGNFVWVKSIGGDGLGYVYNIWSITTDINDNIYTTGKFIGTVDFDPGSGVYNLTCNGGDDVFIYKLDSNGNFIWAKSFGNSSNSEHVKCINTDLSGNVYTTGFFTNTTDFDPGSGIFNLTSNGPSDTFILKLDSNGNFVWAKSFNGINSNSGYSISTDINNNIYTTGDFQGTVDFDPGIGVHNITAINADCFISKLDSNGDFVWARSMGGTSSICGGSSIITDLSGNIYTTGNFSYTVDFNSASGVSNLSSNGSYDVFVLKLSPCSYLSSIDTQISCNSYTWIDGNTYTSSNTTASHTLTNSVGCDSVITLNLTINPTTNSTITDTSCAPYTLNNQIYTASGTYTQTLTNSQGCDSIITLNLNYNPSTSNIIDTVCGSYTLNGQTYTNSGTYFQTLSNVAGCDSVITLNLIINTNQFNPNFTVNQTLFTAPPFAAQFTNTTSNQVNYDFTWDFSDGTILQSNNASVFHQYMYNGLYDVTLIALDPNTGCSDSIFYDDHIFCTGGTSCTHASIINQTGPITACLSDSVSLSCNTNANFTYQWRLNGTYIPGAVDTIYYPTQTGNYSVLIMENGCPEVSPDVSVVISPSPQTPIITSSGNITPCLGGSVVLSLANTYSSYLWSTGSTTANDTVSSSGSYFVTVSNSTGCQATSPSYTINASFASPPEVCIVGIDSLTNYNKVVWEKPITTAIDSFYVYKESNQAGVYQKIGGTAFIDTATFSDISSNPATQAYRYKISLVDSCGVESSLGNFHKSIHLTINQGMGTSYNLIWSHYEGITFSSYNIYKGSSLSNMTLLTTVASNLNSYTDLNTLTGALYYQIEVVSAYTCDPTKSSTYNSSKSNIADNLGNSIIYTDVATSIKAYPNPTNDLITIEIENHNGSFNVEIYDLQGRLLETTKSRTISIKKYSKGIYIFRVSYGDRTEEVRVLRQ